VSEFSGWSSRARPPKNCVQQASPIPEEGNLKKPVPPTLSQFFVFGV
jgi:hypothetical protein